MARCDSTARSITALPRRVNPTRVPLRYASYFVVEPNREQLGEIARLVDDDALRPAIDSVFTLSEARAAFERSLASGKRGKS